MIATELQARDGIFTGRPSGTLNMHGGKVDRLHQWLQTCGYQLAQFSTMAYSDSINDLPLLQLVQHPVAVDPDRQLAAVAAERAWPTLHLR